jgi:hypothetical protein
MRGPKSRDGRTLYHLQVLTNPLRFNGGDRALDRRDAGIYRKQFDCTVATADATGASVLAALLKRPERSSLLLHAIDAGAIRVSERVPARRNF